MEMLLLLIHFIMCMIVLLLLKTGKMKASPVLYPVVLFIPVCGLVLLGIEESRLRGKMIKEKAVGVEAFRISDVRYKRIEVADDADESITVPLEEAIMVNNASVRRKLMMDILHKNPEEYIDLLQMTRTTDDTELTHYATTTMMEIQNKYEAEIHLLSEERKSNPHDVKILKRFRKVLFTYINSGLISGKVLEIYRKQLSGVLKEICMQLPDNRIYFQDYIKNRMALGKFESIEKKIRIIMRRWPEEEQIYQIYIEFLWKCNRGSEIPAVLKQMKERDIYLSKDGKAWMAFWEQKVKDE